MSKELVTISRGRTVTTSLLIAEKFEKEHKDVLKKIERLDCSKEFWRRNYAPSNYKDERGKEQPNYLMTKDGFSFLAMGFTGKKAARFKEDYIAQFNKMERYIQSLYIQKLTPEWQHQRYQLKETTISAMESVKDFVEVAIVKGQEPFKAKMTYASVNKLIYKLLFGITISPKNPLPANFRDTLSRRNLKYLDMALDVVENVYSDSLMCCIDYHTPYQAVKNKLIDFVKFFGAPFSLSDHDYVEIESGFADQHLIDKAA